MPALPDTQSERDTRHVPIRHAGVSALRYPLVIHRADGTSFATIADATMTVSVGATERGTHMSRFVEALHAVHDQMSEDQVLALARTLRTKLKADAASVDLQMTWFVLKTAPITGGQAFMDYKVSWSAIAEGRTTAFRTTVILGVATLCPCSRAIAERGAHNQRGMVTLTVAAKKPVAAESLIQLIEDSASCALYPLLKRPDEKFVTEKAYDSPVFVEDLVRNIAVRLRQHRGLTGFRIEAENLESIHQHNAVAIVTHNL
jgi:GTP cyclohydrolase IB